MSTTRPGGESSAETSTRELYRAAFADRPKWTPGGTGPDPVWCGTAPRWPLR